MTKDTSVTHSGNYEINVEGAVAFYVELRDRKRALKDKLKEDLKPIDDGLLKLEAMLLQHMQDTKAQSIRTESGTCYQYIKRSATVGDRKAFQDFVVEHGLYDLLNWIANPKQVFDWIKENRSDVPGVNASSFMTIGVRRGDANGSTQEDE